MTILDYQEQRLMDILTCLNYPEWIILDIIAVSHFLKKKMSKVPRKQIFLIFNFQ